MGALADLLDRWIEQEFADQDSVSKQELTRRAAGSDLPHEACNILGELPDTTQTKAELHNEIQRMTHVAVVGGNAGGMEAGSSGEMRPGAYGGGTSKTYGGDQSGGYEP